MHTIDLKNKGLRTDLVIDDIVRENEAIEKQVLFQEKTVQVEEVK